ncbi:MAG: putative actin patch assembly and actin polymerization protein [Peltula sp. TS41687]|nr:MAG: putative actin patch assembly and actin polymerization protein [Peltula sp. TS41687]
MLNVRWILNQKKPYTAITVQIENLTSEQYDENDYSGIFDLVEVVRLQNSGPTEAARAIRKKLKYGNVHQQLRALTILDGLIQNAGPRFQRDFADEPLIERLRVAATDPVSDPAVQAKCKALFAQWTANYNGTPGLGRISTLYKQLPQRKQPETQRLSKAPKEIEAEAEDEPRRPSITTTTTAAASSSTTSGYSRYSRLERSSKAKPSKSSVSRPQKEEKESKRSFSKPFNLEKEKPQLLQSLATSSVASTNLMNALKLVNRENQRVSEDAEVVKQFETCKLLRRQILRYIVHVESEQWLGGLIHANEELVNALRTFEVLDKSVEYDSDSEEGDEWDAADAGGNSRGKQQSDDNVARSFAGLTLGKESPRSAAAANPSRYGGSAGKGKGKGKGMMMGRTDDDFDEDERDSDDDDDDDDDELQDEEEDENDPFADRNAIGTPPNEPSSWYV